MAYHTAGACQVRHLLPSTLDLPTSRPVAFSAGLSLSRLQYATIAVEYGLTKEISVSKSAKPIGTITTFSNVACLKCGRVDESMAHINHCIVMCDGCAEVELRINDCDPHKVFKAWIERKKLKDINDAECST